MLRILLNGCQGRMGCVISALAADIDDVEITTGCDVNPTSDFNFPVHKNISDCREDADVVIDFSHPSAFSDVTAFCVENKIPLVMATTGLSEAQVRALSNTAGATPVFYSANKRINDR